MNNLMLNKQITALKTEYRELDSERLVHIEERNEALLQRDANAQRVLDAEAELKEEWEEGEKLGKDLQEANNTIYYLEQQVKAFETLGTFHKLCDAFRERGVNFVTEDGFDADSGQVILDTFDKLKSSRDATKTVLNMVRKCFDLAPGMSPIFAIKRLQEERDRLQDESDNAFKGLLGSSRGECIEWGRRERQKELETSLSECRFARAPTKRSRW